MLPISNFFVSSLPKRIYKPPFNPLLRSFFLQMNEAMERRLGSKIEFWDFMGVCGQKLPIDQRMLCEENAFRDGYGRAGVDFQKPAKTVRMGKFGEIVGW